MAEGLGRNCSAGTVLSGLYHQRRKRPGGNRTPSGAVQDYQEGRKDMKKSYRPGVYSQYDIISKPKSYEQRYAFFCGGAKVKEEKKHSSKYGGSASLGGGVKGILFGRRLRKGFLQYCKDAAGKWNQRTICGADYDGWFYTGSRRLCGSHSKVV